MAGGGKSRGDRASPGDGAPAKIGELTLGERLSDGDERYCEHGCEIAAGEPVYWTEPGYYEGECSPYCRRHAEERARKWGLV